MDYHPPLNIYVHRNKNFPVYWGGWTKGDFKIVCMLWSYNAAAAAKSLQLCPTLCDPMDCSLPGSSAHGLFQARVLEWVAIAFSEECTRDSKINLWILFKNLNKRNVPAVINNPVLGRKMNSLTSPLPNLRTLNAMLLGQVESRL